MIRSVGAFSGPVAIALVLSVVAVGCKRQDSSKQKSFVDRATGEKLVETLHFRGEHEEDESAQWGVCYYHQSTENQPLARVNVNPIPMDRAFHIAEGELGKPTGYIAGRLQEELQKASPSQTQAMQGTESQPLSLTAGPVAATITTTAIAVFRSGVPQGPVVKSASTNFFRRLVNWFVTHNPLGRDAGLRTGLSALKKRFFGFGAGPKTINASAGPGKKPNGILLWIRDQAAISAVLGVATTIFTRVTGKEMTEDSMNRTTPAQADAIQNEINSTLKDGQIMDAVSLAMLNEINATEAALQSLNIEVEAANEGEPSKIARLKSQFTMEGANRKTGYDECSPNFEGENQGPTGESP